MPLSSTPQLERQERFAVSAGKPAVLTFELADQTGRADCVPATLVDLSAGGAKLSVEGPVPMDQPARLKISIEDLGLDFEVAADVCWTRNDEEGRCHVGCTVDPPLPSSFFRGLTSDAQPDRRYDPRSESSCNVSACWELGDDVVPVTVLNYSDGGFCAFCDRETVTGKRLHLCLDKIVIIAKTQWQLAVLDGYLVGCSFLRRRDLQTFAGMLDVNV